MQTAEHLITETHSEFGPDLLTACKSANASFGITKLLSGFTKDMQWKICAEKAWTVVFATYAFVGVSYSDAGEYLKESCNVIY